MYYVQLVFCSLLVVLGVILAIFGDKTIGIIGAVAGITCVYTIIKEKRNQPRQW